MAKTELKNLIRRLRFDHGEMTQQELANRVAVTRQTIIALEANKYAPSLPLAFRIAKVFGVTIEEVFQYDTPPADKKPGDDQSDSPAGPAGPSDDHRS